jgi:UDP-glucuronate 4-epimerase
VSPISGNGTRVLVTGAAGFIGFHAASRLASLGADVLGLDDFNGYYSPALKRARTAKLEATWHVKTLDGDVCDAELLGDLLRRFAPTHVLHLAAQPGVRYSLKHPQVYVRANVQCFVTLLEALAAPASEGGPAAQPYLVYASSSSVYGANRKTPFAEADSADRPTNLYGATKRGNEQTAFAYHQLFGLRSVGCRFFTVYGPWGRPDMAVYSFADAMEAGKPLTLFNGGAMQRDFTYVDDIVDGVVKVLGKKKRARAHTRVCARASNTYLASPLVALNVPPPPLLPSFLRAGC